MLCQTHKVRIWVKGRGAGGHTLLFAIYDISAMLISMFKVPFEGNMINLTLNTSNSDDMTCQTHNVQMG